MGNQSISQNSRLLHQHVFHQQIDQTNKQKCAFSKSISNPSLQNDIQKNKKIPISQKNLKMASTKIQANQNQMMSTFNLKKKKQNNEIVFNIESKNINFNLKQNKNKFINSETEKNNFKKLKRQASCHQFTKNNQDIYHNSFQQTLTNTYKRNPDLMRLQYFINKLKISSASYALKILIESYYQIYIVHEQKVIVSLNDCYVNELGEVIVYYRHQQQTSSVNTPQVLDYYFNFVSVIYKVFQIVRQLIQDCQKDYRQNGYKIQNLYKRIVSLIHYCKQTQNKSIDNVQKRMYKKIMNQIQRFIQQNRFKQNLISDLLILKQNQSVKSSTFHIGSASKINDKSKIGSSPKINDKSKNTKSSDEEQLSEIQSRLLKQAIQKQFNKKSKLQIKNILQKSQNNDEFTQIFNQVNGEYYKNNKKKHKRNATQNNVNHSCDLLKIKSNLYTQANQTLKMRNITERFQQVQSQYSYLKDMNDCHNGNFKKTKKNEFTSGKQYTDQYEKINKNNISYQYAINIINTNTSPNCNLINISQNQQKHKQNKKIKQKKLVVFKQTSQKSIKNKFNEQNKFFQQRRKSYIDQKSQIKFKYQTSIDKLPQQLNPYYLSDGFKQNLNQSIYKGQTTLDNKLQRSRLQMMARQVEVKNSTHPIINYNSDNTIGTEFKF